MDNLQQLINDIAAWSDEAFGEVSTPVAKLKHLQKEIPELIESIEKNDSEELRHELADCFMLLLDCARKCGFTSNDIIDATYTKLEINKSRTWNKPNSDGVFEHVRDSSLKNY